MKLHNEGRSASARDANSPMRHDAQTVLGIMKLNTAKTAALLEEAASSLQGKPSVLSKLVFTAERACPDAAAAAKLRSRFPNWTEETVDTLQQARDCDVMTS